MDLSELSDLTLIEKLIGLNKKESELTGEILLHLIELEKRKLFRERGHSSLYSYCVAELKYSPSAAKRRLTAARCIAKFPGIYELFVQKQVSLTTLSIIAPVLREENQEDILRQVSGKSPQEVEWVAARLNPTKPCLDKIIPILVQTETVKPDLAPENTNKEEIHLGSREPELKCSEIESSKSCAQLVLEERYRFVFSASKAFKEKLDQVKSLTSGKLHPGAKLEQVLEILMNDYINRHSPEKREERRIAREERLASTTYTTKETGAIEQLRTSKYIARRTRDQTYLRDGFSCTYVSSEGIRCGASSGLHLDHIVPRGKGGSDALSNLRVLCGNHNRLVAEQAYGKAFMEQFY